VNSQIWTNDKVVIWWHHGEHSECFFDRVGIFRLMQRADSDKGDSVIFECELPKAREFIEKVSFGDVVELRYVENARLDNPHAGQTLFYIRNIVTTERWMNGPSPVEFSAKVLVIRLQARCVIDMVVDRQ